MTIPGAAGPDADGPAPAATPAGISAPTAGTSAAPADPPPPAPATLAFVESP
ncbi:hypothetical protein HC023_13795, partial [Streptomyces sp. NEAU-H3]|nr:hypothetical protein [Streptomyces sp. NEAU-H3]